MLLLTTAQSMNNTTNYQASKDPCGECKLTLFLFGGLPSS
jgi:hypothetical protein